MVLSGLRASKGLNAAMAALSSLRVTPGTTQWSRNTSLRTSGMD